MTDLALKLAALKVLKDYIEEQYARARAEAQRTMRRGERIVARSPVDDQKIAVIPMSDPNHVTDIVDLDAVTDWYREHYPDLVASGYKVIGSQAEVVEVLFRYAPHLIKRTSALQLEALHELKRSSAALGQPCGPGAELDIPGVKVTLPDPVLTCRPTDEAFDIIRDLHNHGVLELDGTFHVALPEGDAA
jgi:hypothetical protein